MTAVKADRPTLARKVTKGSEANRNAELDQGVRLVVDDKSFVLRTGDISPAIAREFRKTTGRSVRSLIDDLSEDPDIDVIAEAIWVAQRIDGETVALDDVVIDYDLLASDRFDISIAGPVTADEVDDDPKT